MPFQSNYVEADDTIANKKFPLPLISFFSEVLQKKL